VLGPNDVRVADDEEHWRGDRLDLFGRPAFVAVELGHLAHEAWPVVGSRSDLDVGLLPYGSFERLNRVARVLEHLRMKTVAPVRRAAGVHEPMDLGGMSHGELETDGATHAVANDVDECDAGCRTGR
jgi:hypothetical protein